MGGDQRYYYVLGHIAEVQASLFVSCARARDDLAEEGGHLGQVFETWLFVRFTSKGSGNCGCRRKESGRSLERYFGSSERGSQNLNSVPRDKVKGRQLPTSTSPQIVDHVKA